MNCLIKTPIDNRLDISFKNYLYILLLSECAIEGNNVVSKIDVSEFAKNCGRKEHSVQNAIDQLLTDGVIQYSGTDIVVGKTLRSGRIVYLQKEAEEVKLDYSNIEPLLAKYNDGSEDYTALRYMVENYYLNNKLISPSGVIMVWKSCYKIIKKRDFRELTGKEVGLLKHLRTAYGDEYIKPIIMLYVAEHKSFSRQPPSIPIMYNFRDSIFDRLVTTNKKTDAKTDFFTL